MTSNIDTEPPPNDPLGTDAALPSQPATENGAAADGVTHPPDDRPVPPTPELRASPLLPTQPAEATHESSVAERAHAASESRIDAGDDAEARQAAQHERAAPNDHAKSELPPQAAAESTPKLRGRLNRVSKENLLDVLRRLMVQLPSGIIPLEVSKELRELIKLYLASVEKDNSNSEHRPPVEVSELRRRAQQDPYLLNLIEPLLSETELNEVINGSQASASN